MAGFVVMKRQARKGHSTSAVWPAERLIGSPDQRAREEEACSCQGGSEAAVARQW